MVINTTIYNPVKVHFGPGRIAELGEIVRRHGQHALIVTMQELVDSGLVERALVSFPEHGIKATVYADVKPEPKCQEVEKAREFMRQGTYDVVVGIGGGSAMDVAKILALASSHMLPAWSYVDLSNRPPAEIDPTKVLPVITVPTTAGTGAEVTPLAVMINPETVQKGTVKNHAIFPKEALVDPELTLSVPQAITAATGIDALGHLLENYFNGQRRSAYSDCMVEEGLRWLLTYLPRAYEQGGNRQARLGVAYASTVAGITNAQVGTTVVHALGHPAGARLGVIHGVCVGLFLLPVMEHTLPGELDRFARLANFFGVFEDRSSREAQARKCLEGMREFMERVGGIPRLSEYVPNPERKDEVVKTLVDDTLSYMFRPINQHVKVFDREELTEMVKKAW